MERLHENLRKSQDQLSHDTNHYDVASHCALNWVCAGKFFEHALRQLRDLFWDRINPEGPLGKKFGRSVRNATGEPASFSLLRKVILKKLCNKKSFGVWV